MTKTINAYKLRTNLGEYLNEVYYKGNEIIVERRGRPLVKIVQITPTIYIQTLNYTETNHHKEKIAKLNKIAGCVSLDMNLSPKQLKKLIMRQYDEKMLS